LPQIKIIVGFLCSDLKKNQRDNIDKSDLKFLKQSAKKMLSFSDELLDITLQIKELEEIHYV
jgi:hypothetical protein